MASPSDEDATPDEQSITAADSTTGDGAGAADGGAGTTDDGAGAADDAAGAADDAAGTADAPGSDAIDWSVYLVAESGAAGRGTADVVRAAVDAGAGVVQLREKGRPLRERLAVGRDLRQITADAAVPLIVDDRVDLAQAIDADGVHLGDDDLPVATAREILGPDAIVGRSVSFVDDARAAERDGADYLGVGAIYPTSSKGNIPDDEFAVGPERVDAIVDAVSIPVVGIGGITPDNAAPVVDAGADGVAVISAIMGADDPASATATLAESVRDGRS